jgi:hypothetical protein
MMMIAGDIDAVMKPVYGLRVSGADSAVSAGVRVKEVMARAQELLVDAAGRLQQLVLSMETT